MIRNSNLSARMKNRTVNRSKEREGVGVVSRSGFVMGFGFVTDSDLYTHLDL
jgi:hypothetical protein